MKPLLEVMIATNFIPAIFKDAWHNIQIALRPICFKV